MLKATCPKDPSHKRFYTTAVLEEEWEVDEKGNWLETVQGGGQILHGPDSQGTWVCTTCGSTARVEW